MRLAFSFIIAATLTACGGSNDLANANREARALNQGLQADAQTLARSVQVGGNAFSVAVIEGGSYSTVQNGGSYELRRNNVVYALVTPVGQPGPYTANDIEIAARSVSGCTASFGAGVLASVGGFSATSDLSTLQDKTRDFRGWRADLQC